MSVYDHLVSASRYYETVDTAIVDGIEYSVKHLLNHGFANGTTCRFVSIHDYRSGYLKYIIYLDDDGVLHGIHDIRNYYNHKEELVIDARAYIVMVPNLYQLRNGDLSVIADVKRTIDIFKREGKLFHEKMTGINRVPTKRA